MTQNFAPIIMLITPWPLLAIGGIGFLIASRNPRIMRRLVKVAAQFALVAALAANISQIVSPGETVTFFSVPLPGKMGHFAITVDPHALSGIMLLLVAFVGVIVTRFSFTYMEGDSREGVFHQRLSLTLGAFFTLILVGNIWAFWLSWVLTSLFLHKLLEFYENRPGAILAAQKKFLFGRIADVMLFTAFFLLARTLHVDSFPGISRALETIQIPDASLSIAAFLIAISAILKSAQFPFHGWLIAVMEAPTPVSALLHAGLIYTGAFLLLRTNTLLTLVPSSRDLLMLSGILTIFVTSLMMITETNIKESLAYSTCAQMGFMLMECGMGLYSLAFVHILAHSLYKAHAFLSSGSVVEHFRVIALPHADSAATFTRTLGALIIGTGMTGITAWMFHYSLHNPPFLIMGEILSVAVALLLLQGMRTAEGSVRGFLPRILGLCALVDISYDILHEVFTRILRENIPVAPPPPDPGGDVLLGVIAAAFLTLMLIGEFLPFILEKPFWKKAYVHLGNGFYIDLFLSRMITRLIQHPGMNRPFPERR